MTRPRLTLTSLTIGAARPGALADFYARLLGWAVADSDPPPPDSTTDNGWAQVVPPSDEPGPRLNIEFERWFVRPVWPSEPGQQNATQHLDIWVDDLESATSWAVEQGATVAGVQPQDDVRVLFDPEGHPFCLFF